VENKILKHTMLFIKKYLLLFPQKFTYLHPILSYCLASFETVDSEVDIKLLKHTECKPFFKEYKIALKLAKLILKRFGYNIKDVDRHKNKKIDTPPFWIDMSKLFELYVLGLLKDKYNNAIIFQAQGTYGNPDFLLSTKDEKIIIDTKYKPKYQREEYDIEDIRQISGYSRDIGVLKKLGLDDALNAVVDCLIIYPDQAQEADLPNNLLKNPINGFTRFYKVPIKLPVISS
jgi:5-methylcytosine-specific restriction enzyme subunit McrC